MITGLAQCWRKESKIRVCVCWGIECIWGFCFFPFLGFGCDLEKAPNSF